MSRSSACRRDRGGGRYPQACRTQRSRRFRQRGTGRHDVVHKDHSGPRSAAQAAGDPERGPEIGGPLRSAQARLIGHPPRLGERRRHLGPHAERPQPSYGERRQPPDRIMPPSPHGSPRTGHRNHHHAPAIITAGTVTTTTTTIITTTTAGTAANTTARAGTAAGATARAGIAAAQRRQHHRGQHLRQGRPQSGPPAFLVGQDRLAQRPRVVPGRPAHRQPGRRRGWRPGRHPRQPPRQAGRAQPSGAGGTATQAELRQQKVEQCGEHDTEFARRHRQFRRPDLQAQRSGKSDGHLKPGHLKPGGT